MSDMHTFIEKALSEVEDEREESVRKGTQFLFVHAGEVEVDHFKHSVDAIHRYHDARGESPNYERIQQLAHECVERVRQHFRELRSVLEETPTWYRFITAASDPW